MIRTGAVVPATAKAPSEAEAAALSVIAQTPHQATAGPDSSPVPSPGGAPARRAPFERMVRRFERFRGAADALREGGSSGEDVDQELTVMLLREENARLKAARHRPSDLGVMVDRLRLVAAEGGQEESLDDAWDLLAECMLIRQGLDHACDEIQAAISAVQERLTRLKFKAEASGAGERTAPDLDKPVLPPVSPDLDKAVLAPGSPRRAP